MSEVISTDESTEFDMTDIEFDMIEIAFNSETGNSQFVALSEYGSEVLETLITEGAIVMVSTTPAQREFINKLRDGHDLMVLYRKGGSLEAEDDNGNR